MTTSSKEQSLDLGSHKVPQDRLGTILLMFAWPAVWFSLLIYIIGLQFIPEGGTTPTWVLLMIIVLGSGAELVTGLVLLHHEGYPLRISSLQDRIRWQWPKDWKTWLLAVFVFILGMSISLAIGPVNQALATIPGFIPPEWWHAAGNPTIRVNSAADVFPDISLVGNFLFVILYFIIGLVFNIFGEEFYYRGYLLPRMHGIFGRYAWIANGIIFTLKHIYQRWLYPGILVGGLSFAFAAGPLASLPLAMLYHWVGNFLFNMIFLIMAALGVG